ncbi:MAG: hypothetical protein NVS3B18_03350 [Candidatus Dormibacteria bacterium]
MAESLRQSSRSSGDPRRGRVAVVEREQYDRRSMDADSHDLAGEAAPGWSFDNRAFDAQVGTTVPPAAGLPVSNEPRRSSFGPAGKHRTPAAVAVLSVLTLGLYSLVWHHRVNCEMGDFDPRLQVRPARSTWAVGIAWLLGLATTLAGVAVLVAQHAQPARVAALPGWLGYALLAGLLAVPYLTLFLPFGNIAVTMTLERLRLLQEHTGVPGDVQVQPVRAVARLLIPVTGGLSLMVLQQSVLDDVWDGADTAPNRRRRRA